MKESEKLKIASQTEDSDIKSYALLCKSIRESKSEKFKEDILPVLELRYKITVEGGKYTIPTQAFGTIDFFPKANKVLVRRENDWIEPGLSWILKNLLTNPLADYTLEEIETYLDSLGYSIVKTTELYRLEVIASNHPG